MTTHASLPGKPAAFARLHPKLQESLYAMRWTKLRPIQIDAIHEILDGDGDLIISARTAAGKTEAAFLPILSRMVDDHEGSVRAVYAGPLKALINDQFLRLERLCEEAKIPVHKWHGDVRPTAKRRLLDRPSGVLLITPESIESLFVNHPQMLSRVFARLGFFVIDEIHSFLGTERGAHLRSLLTRLAAKSREPVRRVGLSATLGAPEAARRWLRAAAAERVCFLEDTRDKGIRLRLSGYLRPHQAPRPWAPSEEDVEKLSAEDPLLSDVFTAFQGKAALIFANQKSRIEACADFARRAAERRGLPNHFRVHHGSLSRSEREETEDALRSDSSMATFCSSTLEMGIDVGNVKSVGQIGAPWSVNSLAQRLGRSGRKEGESSEIRMYIEEEAPGPNDSIVSRLFPSLLQSVAMTELLLGKWYEPAEIDRLHLSTLVQQVMSVIAESGGAGADQLHAVLVASGAFPSVDDATFMRVLRSMGKADLIEQTAEGLLILGLLGERIVRSRDFYIAFIVPEEYRVTHEGRHIGNLASAPDLAIDGYLILTGRRWKILDVDPGRKVILVEPSSGGRAPAFWGTGGHDIHPAVRERMRSLLLAEEMPIYLDPTAQAMLASARAAAREADLGHQCFVPDGPGTIWFTWAGSRIQRTLAGLGRYSDGMDVHDEGIALAFKKTKEDKIREKYRGFLKVCPDAEELASQFSERAQEKYEPFLSGELQSQVFASHCLDLEGALRIIETL
jgi:ATP-dependent Lhr-like helicase